MFKDGVPVGDDEPILDRPPAALILEGSGRQYGSARQDAVLAGINHHYVRLSPDPVLRLQEMTSDPAERAFIRSIDDQARAGGARVQAIIDGAKVPRDKARVLLVGLAEAGMLEAVEGPVRRRPATVTGHAAARTPQAAPPDGGGGDPYARVPLGLVALALRTQSPAWALGVEPDAPPAGIHRAYQTLARRFHAGRYRPAG